MFLYMLIFMAYHSSRWIPRHKRLKFQILNAVFMAIVLVPQLYVLTRPKSSRYCRQPLMNNLSASIALSFIASGFSVIFTLLDPVPQSLWASYHVFGLLSCGQGLCTAILTLTAAACAETTPELYHMSLILMVASIFSTGEIHFLSLYIYIYLNTYCMGPLIQRLFSSKEVTPACVSSGFFMVRGGIWLTERRPVVDQSRNNER
ncbi:uncharacterized protein [Trachinotus anak]|uniref:uncharacterized protein n=1 Tax=Trachinotus anak TaxID=443729 RepID=UPI0039F1B772